jgi:hypothetical protein
MGIVRYPQYIRFQGPKAKVAPQGGSFFDNIGQKMRQAGEVIGTAKGIHDTGRAPYNNARAAAPYLNRAGAALEEAGAIMPRFAPIAAEAGLLLL